MKTHSLLSFFACSIWFINGLFVLGSMYLGWDGWAINTTVGLLFLGYAYYLYLRGKSIKNLQKSYSEKNQNPLKRFFRLENLLLGLHIFVGILAFSAIVSRVFGEGFSVFG